MDKYLTISAYAKKLLFAAGQFSLYVDRCTGKGCADGERIKQEVESIKRIVSSLENLIAQD